MISLTPDLSLLVIMAIFIVNCFVVSKFLLQPINRILVARKTEIQDADLRFENALAKFNEATATVESSVQQAKREAAKIRDGFRAEATSTRQGLLDKTRNEAEALVRSAEQDLETHVSDARKRIDDEAETLGRLAAERIVGRKLA